MKKKERKRAISLHLGKVFELTGNRSFGQQFNFPQCLPSNYRLKYIQCFTGQHIMTNDCQTSNILLLTNRNNSRHAFKSPNLPLALTTQKGQAFSLCYCCSHSVELGFWYTVGEMSTGSASKDSVRKYYVTMLFPIMLENDTFSCWYSCCYGVF